MDGWMDDGCQDGWMDGRGGEDGFHNFLKIFCDQNQFCVGDFYTF